MNLLVIYLLNFIFKVCLFTFKQTCSFKFFPAIIGSELISDFLMEYFYGFMQS